MGSSFRQWLRCTLLVSMALGAALITVTSLDYFDFSLIPEFMLERLPLRFEALYLLTLRVHVAAALVGFPLCIALMTRTLQRHALLHRVLGRVAGIVLLAALVPSGFVLALHAKGGLVVAAGFVLSGTILGACTIHGVVAIRRRNTRAHARAMRHVFAQMTVAVTSRLMLFGFDAVGVDPNLAYVVALWVPVLASAAAAELAVLSIPATLERVRHAITNVLARLRPRMLARVNARHGR